MLVVNVFFERRTIGDMRPKEEGKGRGGKGKSATNSIRFLKEVPQPSSYFGSELPHRTMQGGGGEKKGGERKKKRNTNFRPAALASPWDVAGYREEP